MEYIGQYTALPSFLTSKVLGSGIGLRAVGSDEDCSNDGYVCVRDGGCSSHTICGMDGCSSDATCTNDHMCSFDGICVSNVCVTDVEPPGSAGQITSHTATKNSIRLYFTTIYGATSYEVVWRLASERDLLGSTIVTGNSADIDGLDPNTEYVFNYKGRNKGGEGPFMSSPYYASTTSDSNTFLHDGSTFRRAIPLVHDGSKWVVSTSEVHDGSHYVP